MNTAEAALGHKYTIVCTDGGPSYRPCDGCAHQAVSPTPDQCRGCSSMLRYPIAPVGKTFPHVILYLEHGTNWKPKP